MLKTEEAHPRRRGRPRDRRVEGKVIPATLALVSESGVGHLTTDAVAARAGVSKATMYRRWPSKQALLREAAGALVAEIEVPDTGALAGDVRALVGAAIELYASELPGRIIPALISEMAFDDDLAAAIRDGFLARRREAVTTVLHRARARGELRAAIDDELALDLMAGVIYYRFLVTGGALDADLAERLTQALLNGMADDGRGA